MALTLIEAAKQAGQEGDVYRSGVIELYARSSDLLSAMPFENINGNAYKYNQEETLPGVGFRGVNQGYTESTGVINPVTENLVIAGGDLDVDKFIIDTHGAGKRDQQEAMKVKALSGRLTKALIKGDNTANVTELSGLQARVAGDQIISAGSTSGGAALSLTALDELIDAVDEPTHLIMGKALARRLKQAARNTSVGGNINFTTDEFGKSIMMYDGIPFLIVDKDNEQNLIMPFDEAASSGAATATSLYCVSLQDDGVVGLQNGNIDVRDLGELESKPVFRTRVEWYVAMAILRGTAAARLNHIGDLAVTA